MPVKRGSDSKGPYYRWGSAKKYYYKAGCERSRKRAQKMAEQQARAIYASGYRKKK